MARTNKLTLFEGVKGDLIKISTLRLEGIMRRRLLDLGFVPGAIVEVLRKSPLGDPIAFRVSSTSIALRKEESIRIEGELINHG
ncbi:FeoA family protein [Mesobacillus selenatarsenatis]|uniref:Ferrous iron transport protein A n=1 Tax=Mesobacillus selenatarsenatis TaxID=388741 RepID=A0A846TQT1_9BACI|nr:FeoA domain-containing protein [Mesobacillus selenatarsenatis]NKE07647.1 ferrous iron transport protein A [Mesobacillus selenatarsenatis]